MRLCAPPLGDLFFILYSVLQYAHRCVRPTLYTFYSSDSPCFRLSTWSPQLRTPLVTILETSEH